MNNSTHRLNFSNNFGIINSKNTFSSEQKYQINNISRTPFQIRLNDINVKNLNQENLSKKFLKFDTIKKNNLNRKNMKTINECDNIIENNEDEINHDNCYCMFTPSKQFEFSNQKFKFDNFNSNFHIQTPVINYEEYSQRKFNLVNQNDLNDINNYIKTPSKFDNI